MKKIILSCLATATILTFSNCETEGHDHHHRHDRGSSTTTTTEETTVTRPVTSTVETQTIRGY